MKLSVVDLGNMTAAMLDEALLSLSDSEHIKSSGFSVDSDNDSEALVDGCSYLNFLFVSFKVFQFNLLFHDFAFCLHFDHSIPIFHFWCALYRCMLVHPI